MTASLFEEEIREQPALIDRMASGGRTRLADAASAIRARSPAFAILAARGSSDNAARYAKYVWGAHNGLAVGLAAPALHTVYDRPPRFAGALVAGISQSGQSPVRQDPRPILAAPRPFGTLSDLISARAGRLRGWR